MYEVVDRKYSVVFDMGGHGSQIETIKTKYNTLISEPTAPTANGYKFEGWYKDKGFTVKFDFTNDKIDKDTTIYVKWTAVPKKISIPVIAGAAAGGAAVIGTTSTLIIRKKRKLK